MNLLEQHEIVGRIVRLPFSGCWIWMASISWCGHGQATFNGKVQYVHRISYQIYIGGIPDGLNILHKCNVACCVNPEHLYLGTQSDNVRDMLANRPAVTYCKRGHVVWGDNLYLYQGIKRCRFCKKISIRRRLSGSGA